MFSPTCRFSSSSEPPAAYSCERTRLPVYEFFILDVSSALRGRSPKERDKRRGTHGFADCRRPRCRVRRMQAEQKGILDLDQSYTRSRGQGADRDSRVRIGKDARCMPRQAAPFRAATRGRRLRAKRGDLFERRLHNPTAITKADASKARAPAMASENDFVSVLQELPPLAGR